MYVGGDTLKNDVHVCTHDIVVVLVLHLLALACLGCSFAVAPNETLHVE